MRRYRNSKSSHTSHEKPTAYKPTASDAAYLYGVFDHHSRERLGGAYLCGGRRGNRESFLAHANRDNNFRLVGRLNKEFTETGGIALQAETEGACSGGEAGFRHDHALRYIGGNTDGQTTGGRGLREFKGDGLALA